MKTKWKIHFFNAVSSAVEGRNAQFGMNEKKSSQVVSFFMVSSSIYASFAISL